MAEDVSRTEKEIRPSPEKPLAELVKEPVRLEFTDREDGKRKAVEYWGLQADCFYYGGEEFRDRLGEKFAGEERLKATVEHLYFSLPDETREAMFARAKEVLKENDIAFTDPKVSLFRFFQIKGPDLIAETTREKVENGRKEISKEDKVRLEQLNQLDQTARGLDLEGARQLPRKIRELQETVAKAVGVVKRTAKETEELREKSEKAVEENQWLREQLEEAKARGSSNKITVEELERLAGLARGGKKELRELDKWVAEMESPDVTAVVYLLKTIRDSLGKEKFDSLLKGAAETFERYQFVKVGEIVKLGGRTYRITKRLGGGAMGEVFLSETIDEWASQSVWKVSKYPELIKAEITALTNIDVIQSNAGFKDVSYVPNFKEAGAKEENFATPFIRMEYVPGKDLVEIMEEVATNKRPPFGEEEVRKVFLQAAHLGSLLEAEKQNLYVCEGELSMASDFKVNRIKVYDENNMKIKVIDWSVPTLKENDLPKKTREVLGTIGRVMNRLLGSEPEKCPKKMGEEMKTIILKCLGTQEEKFPPYKTFTELYEDLKSLSF